MTPRPGFHSHRAVAAAALPALALAGSAAARPTPARPPGRPAPRAPDTVVVRGAGFRGPENLAYDSVADCYYVANVNGPPAARAGNGYVSRVGPDGSVRELTWIAGGRGGVTLDGPMGIAVRGDTLAVADLGAVRFFARTTGRPLGAVAVPGLRLNDLAYAGDGSLWVTDVGPDRHTVHGAQQVDTSRDMDAVYQIVPGRPGGRVRTVARGLALHRPDGISPWPDGGALITTFGDSVLRPVGGTAGGPAEGAVVAHLPGGRVDGLRPAPGGGWLVSSWDARAVYRWRPGEPLLPVLTGLTSPAGVAVDTRRNRLAVTSMQENTLTLLPLPPARRP